MKAHRTRLLASLLLLVCGAICQPQAHADALDDFIGLMKELDEYHVNPSPVSGQMLEDAQDFLQCLKKVQNDAEAAGCLDAAHGTSLGSAIEKASGVDTPDWFWDVIHGYIAFRTHDYWGVVKFAGKAGICIVAQIMVGGATDVCGLVKAIVEMAKGLLDAGKAMAEFIGAIGGGIADGLKTIGCMVNIGDCDSKSTPEHEIVYTWIFSPRVLPQGLAHIEDVDAAAFPQYIDLLKANARHDPVIWSSATVADTWKDHPPFSAASVDIAAKVFEKTVIAQWESDLGEHVMKELGAQRADYLTQSNFVAAALYASAAYHKAVSNKPNPAQVAQNVCIKEFNIQRGFAHVDRWLALHPGGTVAQLANGQSNTTWCAAVFWQQHLDEFAAQFRTYAKGVFKCAAGNGALICPNLAAYQECAGLLGSVYQKSQCGIAVQAVGLDIAKEISAYFVAKGSKYPCDILPASNPNAAATLRCVRPTQRVHCDNYYSGHFADISPKALDCALAVTAPYQARQKKLWEEFVPALEVAHPKFKQTSHAAGDDPLQLGVTPELFAEMSADAKKLGMLQQTVLTLQPSIDGIEAPTLAGNYGPRLKAAHDTVPMSRIQAPKRGGVNPPDPAGPRLQSAVSPSTANAAVANAMAAQARLAVVAARTRLEISCVDSRASIFASVTVTNGGDALAAGGVTVVIQEAGTAARGSASLPAIDAGKSTVIQVPLRGINLGQAATVSRLAIQLVQAPGGRTASFALPAVQSTRVNVPPNPCLAPPPARAPAARATPG